MAGGCRMLFFGQAVVGPPGAGKSTYCKAMREFLTALGRRVILVNLDPANEDVPYTCDVDVQKLVSVAKVMDEFGLGPNGALLYCMEYLEANMDWLKDALDAYLQAPLEPTSSHKAADLYMLFDFPGQVELYTHHNAVRALLDTMVKRWSCRLVTVHLTDAHYCTDPARFVSVLLTSLTTMVHLETPHVNLLSKVDLIEHYAPLPFSLDFFTDVLDLKYLVGVMHDDPFVRKHRRLTEAICDVVERYSLVSFLPLNIQDKENMAVIVSELDKANGYCFAQLDRERLHGLLSQTSATSEQRSAFLRKIADKYTS